MKLFRSFLLLFFIGGMSQLLPAQNGAASRPVPGPRRIIVTLSGGATIMGNLMRLDPDKLEMIGPNGLRVISVDDLKSIVFDHSAPEEAGPSTDGSDTEAHSSEAPQPPPAPRQTVAVPSQTPAPGGTVQDPPRGYTKPRDRPSRRGSREAARKLEEINRQREPKEEPDNSGTQTGNGNPQNTAEPPAPGDAAAPGNVATGNEEDAAAAEAARLEKERRETERLERERAKRLERERAARERAARERKERLERERRERAERERREREEREVRERAERERKEREARERKNKKDRPERGKDKKSEAKKETEKKPAQKPEPARKGRKG